MFKLLKQIIVGGGLIVVTLFLSINSAMAAPVNMFDTVTAPDSTNGYIGVFGTNAFAQAFTTDSNGGEINSLVIQDAYTNATTTGIDLKIHAAGAEGVVGAPLVSFTFNSGDYQNNGILPFTPDSSVILSPNTTYWVVVKSTDFFIWKYGTNANTGTGTIPETNYRAKSTDSGTTFVYDSSVNSGDPSYTNGPWNFNMRVLVNPPLSIEPISASDIGRTTTTLQGRFQNPSWDTNNPDITASIGFLIGTSAGFAAENYVAADEVSSTAADVDGYYSVPFSTLTCGTDYYVRSYINVYDENPGGENRLFLFGETSTNEISFTTDGCFTVAMDDISSISQTSATLQALVQNPIWDDVDSFAELRFYVDTVEDFGSENSFSFQAESMDEGGYYSATIPVENALTCGTTYYVYTEVYAYDQGETWSETIGSEASSFTTADCDSPRSRVVGGYASPAYLAQQGIVLQNTKPTSSLSVSQCSPSQILTQNLKAPSRNGIYNSYTKAIVAEAHILQAHLNRLGFNSGKEDGIIGPISTGAIKRMQMYLKTTPDGYVGPITRGLINNSCGKNSL